MKRPFLVVLLIGVAVSAGGQTIDSSAIVFDTLGGKETYFLNGTRIANAEPETVMVSPGRHVVERVLGDPYRWTLHRMTDTVVVGAGEIVRLPDASHAVFFGTGRVRDGEPTADMSPYRGTTGPASLRPVEPDVNNPTWTILSAVAMVGSSVAAAYLKERANASLDEYYRTRSDAALRDVRRFDTYSAVAAATMVISFSGFAIFLTARQ